MNEQQALNDWKTLYEAAIAFKKQAPWAWMYDSDLFGVQNPETGEVGYCCIMGNLGEVFALGVYQGAEGLAGYRFLQEGPGPSGQATWRDAQTLLAAQFCLMASLEDRNELDKRDLDVIRKLGLKFRGRREWPMFRSYRPGYAPWFITPSEVRFLAMALQQTVEVAAVCKKKPDWLGGGEGDQIMVRVQEDGQWRDVWQNPETWEAQPAKPVIDEVLVARIKQAGFPRGGTLIADCVMLPTEVADAERPYFPWMFFVLSDEGLALGMEMCMPGEVEKDVPAKFLELLMQMENIPQSLLVGSLETSDLLAPIAEQLNFSIHVTEEHPMLDFFLNSLGEYLIGDR